MIGIVAIAIGAASLVLNIVGVAIPYWLYDSVDGGTINVGLWQACGSGGGNSACVTIPSEADAYLTVMAVDLGSEYIKIAIFKPVIPMKIIHNEDSNRKTATMVAMWNEERMFGNPAENTPTKYPSQVFWYLSQIVGKKYEVPAVDLYKRRFPYYNLVKDELRGTVLFKIDDAEFDWVCMTSNGVISRKVCVHQGLNFEVKGTSSDSDI